MIRGFRKRSHATGSLANVADLRLKRALAIVPDHFQMIAPPTPKAKQMPTERLGGAPPNRSMARFTSSGQNGPIVFVLSGGMAVVSASMLAGMDWKKIRPAKVRRPLLTG
jgi:hypothetical protein